MQQEPDRHGARRLPSVQVLEEEYERLSDIVCGSTVETEAIALLGSELLRAAIVSPEHAPADLVRLDSLVRFTDLASGEQTTVRLVYPRPEGLAPGEVSAESLLGAALVGLRPGAEFTWGEGRRAIRIDAVENPPPSRSSAGRPAEAWP
jgi:regulator of nucleoside diphosphate kinase